MLATCHSFLEQIVASSNLYASQTQTASQAISWRKIIIIGFCVLMGVAKQPSIADYWQKDPIYNYQPISSTITTDRFRDIRRCQLGRDVAIDEALVKFQGRSTLKQYLPMKPIKRGIKA